MEDLGAKESATKIGESVAIATASKLLDWLIEHLKKKSKIKEKFEETDKRLEAIENELVRRNREDRKETKSDG